MEIVEPISPRDVVVDRYRAYIVYINQAIHEKYNPDDTDYMSCIITLPRSLSEEDKFYLIRLYEQKGWRMNLFDMDEQKKYRLSFMANMNGR